MRFVTSMYSVSLGSRQLGFVVHEAEEGSLASGWVGVSMGGIRTQRCETAREAAALLKSPRFYPVSSVQRAGIEAEVEDARTAGGC